MRYKGGGRSRKNPLYFGRRSDYVPAKLNQMDEADLRKEYSRLRDIAQKRLKRMASEWSWTESYKQNVYAFNKLSAIRDKRTLVHKLSQLSRFVTAETGSASGLNRQRNKALATLHSHGYDFVTKENFREFIDFLEWARSLRIARMYDSERVADIWGAVQETKSKEEIEKMFLKYEEKLKIDDPIISAEEKTSSTIMRKSAVSAVKAVKKAAKASKKTTKRGRSGRKGRR